MRNKNVNGKKTVQMSFKGITCDPEPITLHVVNPKDGRFQNAFKYSPRSQNTETFLHWDVS